MCYASFILTEYAAEELNQNYDDVSCVTGFTDTTGTTFYTQYRKMGLYKTSGHAVGEPRSKYKNIWTVAASVHLQYMESIKNKPSKWEYLEYSHMNHKLWGGFSTYTGQHAGITTMVRFFLR